MQTVTYQKVLMGVWRKRTLTYEHEKARGLEVLVSRMREYNGETSAHRIGPLFWIVSLARPFLPRGEKAVRQHGRGANPSLIPPRMHALKGETNAPRVRVQSRFLRF